MAKPSRTIIYSAVGAIVIYGVFVLMTSDDPKTKTAKPRATAQKSSKTALYLPEDYKASFPAVTTTVKNVMRPLVVRATDRIGAAAETSIPASFTGGDGNWIYTGLAEVDGRSTALLENESTGEGVFLKVGERWKQCIVAEIKADSVVLVGPDGQSKRVHLQAADNGSMTPLKVGNPLNGPIGTQNGGIGVTPQAPTRAQSNRNGDGNEG